MEPSSLPRGAPCDQWRSELRVGNCWNVMPGEIFLFILGSW